MDRVALAAALPRIAFAATTIAVAGCSASPKVTLAAVGSSPGAAFSSGGATVPVGVVLGFGVTVESSTAVTAAVDDPTLVTVAPTVNGAEFVLIGLATGQTTLRVYVNDEDQTDLSVQIVGTAD
jgi:hypothetical protein